MEFIYPSDKGDIFEFKGKKIKGLSLGMGYPFNVFHKVKFRSEKNFLEKIVLGTYGLGSQRIIYAYLDANRDEMGFNFPEVLVPYDSGIILVNPKDSAVMTAGKSLYVELNNFGSVYLDDRQNISLKEKLDYSDFIGVKKKYILGKREIGLEKIHPILRSKKQINATYEGV